MSYTITNNPKTKVKEPQLDLYEDFRKEIVNNLNGSLVKRSKSKFLYNLFLQDASSLTKDLIKSYKDSFQLIYLDPPYNTKRSRGSRKHYSDNSAIWSDHIHKVVDNSYKLLKKEGFLVLSINQMELFNLKTICDSVFGSECFIGLFPVKIRHSERQLMINATYHDVFEYLLFYRKHKQTRFFTEQKHPRIEKFDYRIELLTEKPKKIIINGKEVEVYSPEQYKIIQDKPSLKHLRRYIIAGKLATANWSGEFFESHLRKLGENLLIKVHGLEKEGLGYRWFHTQNEKRNSGVYFQSSLTAGRPVLPTNDLDFTEIVPNIYKEGGSGTDFKDSKKPEQLLEYIISITTRENDLVGDFYGGSGTTIAKCIKMNRSCFTGDNGVESIKIISKRLSNLKEGKDICGIKYNFQLQSNI
ncbi:MAG: site-specific DNA-methyltransferase [Parachlamydia sp.]|jgi:adenine-specific DNA-methyltransferase|nr:site-specific DNA-methyltransferase [Parachlamydia sp.]